MKKYNINHIYLFQLCMIILLIVLGTSKLNAQLKVGNNPKTLNQNSLFEMESTNKGMLMPRLALVHPDSFTPMTAHIKGMIVFNTDSTSNVKPGLYYNSGTKWLKIPSAMVVNNGLSLSNDSLALGGTIIKPTTIAGLTDTNKMQFIGQGNNMFSIDDSIFSVDGTKNNIGIGTKTPINSALLELNSTNKGLLLPRVQLTSLTSPLPLDAFIPGMVVYCIGNAGTAPNNVTEGFYIAGKAYWSSINSTLGDKGDIILRGERIDPLLVIENGVITYEKLANSLKVGGGPPTNTSVALEVAGTNKGFVVSTVSNLNSISNPVIGMIVYATTENCLRIYTDKGWSNCLLAATGDASTGGSAVVTSYTTPASKNTTPVFGRLSTVSTTTSATVATVGNYNIIATSPTLPRFTFTATGTFSATGAQTITLNATRDIPATLINTVHIFTSNTTPSFSFNLTINNSINYASGTGSAFNAFYNGIKDEVYTGTDTTISHTIGETYNFNTTCNGKAISQTSPANCPATITGASGTIYPLVWINGQCWMQTNLNEIPSNFPDTPNTGNNIWLNTPASDIGKWGYYNVTTPDGTAGWALAEPALNEGILYQWSAAMNNATAERSQGACPVGYHIPSDCEWMFLEHGLGMSIALTNTHGWRNSGSVGNKLRSAGNNVTGFSGILTGYKNFDFGLFTARGARTWFWTSTQISANVVFHRTLSGANGVEKETYFKKPSALSVRCLKN